MHKRSFVMGIGIGIIIGALLMQLFLIGEQSESNLLKIDQKINGEDITPTTSVEETIPKSDAAESLPKESEQPMATAHSEEASNVDTLTTEDVNMPTSPETPELAYIVRIQPKASLTQAAELLEQHNLVEKSEDFIKIFKQQNSTIRAGYFYVEEDQSLTDLYKIFTGKPMTEAEANLKIEIESIKKIE